MKTFKAFKFYPIVYYHGLKGDGKGANRVKDRTLINLNVGGQVFRMQEAQFKGGILQ